MQRSYSFIYFLVYYYTLSLTDVLNLIIL